MLGFRDVKCSEIVEMMLGITGDGGIVMVVEVVVMVTAVCDQKVFI